MEIKHDSVTIPVEKGQTVPISDSTGIWAASEAQGKAVTFLSQVGELDRKIRLKKAKLEVLRDALSLRSPVMSDMPKAPSPSLQSMEDRLCDILTLEDEIKALEKEMVLLKADMMRVIGRIDDLNMQMILICCYLDLCTNAQACKQLHYSRGWLLKLKAQALTKLDAILDQEGASGK